MKDDNLLAIWDSFAIKSLLRQLRGKIRSRLFYLTILLLGRIRKGQCPTFPKWITKKYNKSPESLSSLKSEFPLPLSMLFHSLCWSWPDKPPEEEEPHEMSKQAWRCVERKNISDCEKVDSEWKAGSTHMNWSLPLVMSGNVINPSPKTVKGREEQFFLVIINLTGTSNQYTFEDLTMRCYF